MGEIKSANFKGLYIVIKSVWGAGFCPRGHESMQKQVLKTAFFQEQGGQDPGVPLLKGASRFRYAPPPADPHNHRARVVGMRPLSPSTWRQGALGRTPKQPPNVEGMWPGMVQEGGCSLVPPLFLQPARLCARIRVWYGFLGGPPHHFFLNFGSGFPCGKSYAVFINELLCVLSD
ncbi:hypothetical protein AB205_0108250 [Aquarana catesbeiana]|uniref:Uncharacterized protein n=1 Tax=Aquarana catesbeiana TaxID=8400 RepID=A0A2G9R4R6_AQUCT|nr:hypothetical protein AB205_0108250 [Aquarana catesbeiana]